MPLLSRVLLGFLFVQLSIFQAPAAEPSRISFGFSSIGAAGTGVWMAKEIGAFENMDSMQTSSISLPGQWCCKR